MENKVIRNILIITSHFLPSVPVGVYRTLAWIKLLIKKDWSVFIITSNKIEDPIDLDLCKKISPLINIIYSGHLHERIITSKQILHKRKSSPKTGLLPRNKKFPILHWLKYWFKIPDRYIFWIPYAFKDALNTIHKYNISLIYSTSPLPSAHIVAYLIKKKTNLPWVSDFRDPWVSNPSRQIPYKLHRYWDKFLERKVVKTSDIIICNTSFMKIDFEKRYPNIKNKLVVIPNGWDPENYTNLQAIRIFDNNYFILSHAGTFYGPRPPSLIFEPLKIFKRKFPEAAKRFRLVLIGPIHYESTPLSKIACHYGIEDLVKIIPEVPREEVYNYLKGSDALLVIGYQGPGAEIQVPAKFYEYLPIKKPLLVLVPKLNSAISEMFSLAGNPGIQCPIKQPEKVAEALKELIDRKEEGINSNIEIFNRHLLFKQLEKVFNELITKH